MEYYARPFFIYSLFKACPQIPDTASCLQVFGLKWHGKKNPQLKLAHCENAWSLFPFKSGLLLSAVNRNVSEQRSMLILQKTKGFY